MCAHVHPLQDPAYQPEHQPVNGKPPAVIAKWGPSSQLRWFTRFRQDIRMSALHAAPFHCDSAQHLGFCCPSCVEDQETGYDDYLDDDRCCCRAQP